MRPQAERALQFWIGVADNEEKNKMQNEIEMAK